MSSLYEQWLSDIKQFINPETLWEIKLRSVLGLAVPWRDAKTQFEVEELFNLGHSTNSLRRKISVARPFNLIEAQNGAEVEINVGGMGGDKWILGEFQGKIDYIHDSDRYLVSGEDCSSAYLRMRNPIMRK